MSQADALGALPEWDLTDLYPGPDSPTLKADLDGAETEAKTFRDTYAGKLETLDGAAMAAAVQRYEKLGETMGRIMSYASSCTPATSPIRRWGNSTSRCRSE